MRYRVEEHFPFSFFFPSESTKDDRLAVVSWGDAAWCLGHGPSRANLCPQPGLVRDLPIGMRVSCVSAGSSHSSVVLENGRVYSWGLNIFGELGVCEKELRVALVPMPAKLPDEIRFKDVACGGGFTLCLDEAGSVWSWGRG